MPSPLDAHATLAGIDHQIDQAVDLDHLGVIHRRYAEADTDAERPPCSNDSATAQSRTISNVESSGNVVLPSELTVKRPVRRARSPPSVNVDDTNLPAGGDCSAASVHLGGRTREQYPLPDSHAAIALSVHQRQGVG